MAQAASCWRRLAEALAGLLMLHLVQFVYDESNRN